MLKNNKKLVIFFIMLLLFTISFYTYATYSENFGGSDTAVVADWVVKVNNTDIVNEDEFSFSSSDVVWEDNDYIEDGKIAPGSVGKIYLTIDASDSKVAVDYTVSTVSSDNNSNIVVSNIGVNKSGTINYSTNPNNMKKTIEITIIWNGVDSDNGNSQDNSISGSDFDIDVTVTTKQHVN